MEKHRRRGEGDTPLIGTISNQRLMTSQNLDGSGDHPMLLHLVGIYPQGEIDKEHIFVVAIPKPYQVRDSF